MTNSAFELMTKVSAPAALILFFLYVGWYDFRLLGYWPPQLMPGIKVLLASAGGWIVYRFRVKARTRKVRFFAALAVAIGGAFSYHYLLDSPPTPRGVWGRNVGLYALFIVSYLSLGLCTSEIVSVLFASFQRSENR